MVWSKPAAGRALGALERRQLSWGQRNKEEQQPGAREMRRAVLMGGRAAAPAPLTIGPATAAAPGRAGRAAGKADANEPAGRTLTGAGSASMAPTAGAGDDGRLCPRPAA